MAARVAADFIRRPEVAARVISDPTARHLVNQAQIDRSKQVCEIVRKRTPAVERLEHTAQFMDLIGACAAFTAAVGRVIPTLRGTSSAPMRWRRGPRLARAVPPRAPHRRTRRLRW
ncbi:DUF6192 family protein [Nocardia brasiliensis]|uniref:DUF6192 family protein n=1 Tax=Nocardia brasiliensis TaxID=37326 RepID=UPI0004A735CE|nr:DUF6192 family protein [Nocardia brasiliensis]